jgi:serine/threonine protein kinase
MLEILPDVLTPGLVVAGRYRLDRVVGEGGMGIVWAATHVLTEKKCALKFLKESRASDPRNHQRLLQEARSACAVRHPNVAQVHDILELASGVPFIVMDLLEGESLAGFLARVGKLSVPDAIRILQPVVDAVAAAHKLGIVHRDLKPDNVFIEKSPTGKDVVKVLDFGIAKKLGGDQESSRANIQRFRERSRLTTTFSVVGTPLYMAPEQIGASGPIELAEPVDVWALGIIAFESVTGRRPAGLEASDTVDATALYKSIEDLEPDIPRSFARLIRRMLQVDPTRRASLAEVRDALLLQSPDLATTMSVDAVTTEIAAAAAAQRTRNWQRAVPWAGAAVVVSSLFVLSKLREEPKPEAAAPKAALPAPTIATNAAFMQPAFSNGMQTFREAPAQSAEPAASAVPPPDTKRPVKRRPAKADAKQPQNNEDKPAATPPAPSDGIPSYDRK